MKRRFLVWSLVGLLVTIIASGMVARGQPGHAATSGEAIAPPPIVEETQAPTPALAQSCDVPPPLEPEGAGAEETRPTLTDLEPPLPAESSPAPSSSEPPPAESGAGAEGTSQLTKQQRILMAADEAWLAGDRATAEAYYRQVKDGTWFVDPQNLRPLPIFDPAELPPAGAVYWREAQAGYDLGLPLRTLVPLEMLVENYPQFIPAQVFYAEYLMQNDRAEEARGVLERALMTYPTQPDLLQAQTRVQMALERWLEAAITANQFVLLHPDHANAAAFEQLRQENLDRFRAEMKANLTNNLIGNLITGAAGLFLTGGLIGPYTALDSTLILLQGESNVGAAVAEKAKAQLPMVSDREVEDYVAAIGHRLAQVAGRDEFNYEFYVVNDSELNAFALPGGKIFINSGAILKAHSEAELAGLLAHELSHAVLSHGFQMATSGNLITSIAGYLPLPEVTGIAAGLVFSGYSRQMERQADILGTQLLSAAGYAADGLHNLMVTLGAETGDRAVVPWFSSHPAPAERLDYLKQIVEFGGFNRYAYEGIANHLAIQQRVAAYPAPDA